MNNEEYINFIKLNQDTPEYVANAFVKKDKEIDRLNNITNEFTTYLEKQVEYFKEPYVGGADCASPIRYDAKGEIVEEIYTKWKELKGDSNG